MMNWTWTSKSYRDRLFQSCELDCSGMYNEGSVMDDINGTLTCTECGHKVDRYQSEDENKMIEETDWDKLALIKMKEKAIQEDQWDTATRGQKMSNPTGYTVFKYQVPVLERFTLKLPYGAQILRLAHIDGISWLWALVNTKVPDQERTFVAFKTGGTNPYVESIDNLKYVGYYEIYVQQGLGLYVFEEI